MRTQIRNLAALLLVATLLVGFAGCGGNEVDSGTSTPENAKFNPDDKPTKESSDTAPPDAPPQPK